MIQLIHLFLLVAANSVTLFVLSILLIRNIWCLGANTTTIEGWEIERHKTVLRRARYFGGYLDGPDGVRVRIERQEFPYDIGIWQNFKQGMGSGNVHFQLKQSRIHFVSGANFRCIDSHMVLAAFTISFDREWTRIPSQWV